MRSSPPATPNSWSDGPCNLTTRHCNVHPFGPGQQLRGLLGASNVAQLLRAAPRRYVQIQIYSAMARSNCHSARNSGVDTLGVTGRTTQECIGKCSPPSSSASIPRAPNEWASVGHFVPHPLPGPEASWNRHKLLAIKLTHEESHKFRCRPR